MITYEEIDGIIQELEEYRNAIKWTERKERRWKGEGEDPELRKEVEKRAEEFLSSKKRSGIETLLRKFIQK